MRLNIKNLKGQSFQIPVDHSFCFLDVKKAIKELKEVPIQKQKLVYKGKVIQDETILSDIGVKDEDNLVLMNVVSKKGQTGKKQDIVENIKQNKVQQNSTTKQNINQQGQCQWKNEKMDKGKQNDKFQDHDIENICDMLGISPQQFQIILEENPEKIDIVLQALEDNEVYGVDEEQEFEEEFEIEEQFEDFNSELEQIAFTVEQEKSIEKLIVLGFAREEVVSVYIACDKNEELTANMLFNQQDNGQL